jgi:hypothetical protein
LELCDPSLIAALVSTAVGEKPIPPSVDRPQATRTAKRRRSCQCGSCATCLDNAKWERIFSEKFADADYYKPRSVWGGSSLG